MESPGRSNASAPLCRCPSPARRFPSPKESSSSFCYSTVQRTVRCLSAVVREGSLNVSEPTTAAVPVKEELWFLQLETRRTLRPGRHVHRLDARRHGRDGLQLCAAVADPDLAHQQGTGRLARHFGVTALFRRWLAGGSGCRSFRPRAHPATHYLVVRLLYVS